jgi:hypothetical protein
MENKFINNLTSNETSSYYFKATIFFLPSIPVISSLFGIVSLVLAHIKTKNKFFEDKYNYPFMFVGIIMVLSLIKNISLNQSNNIYENIFGLFNWLPYLYAFWGFQYYLDNPKKRKDCITIYLIGSVPLLVGGFLQYFFGVYGPFSFFNKLFIWFQRPMCFENIEGVCSTGITSAFNHANYYGSWLLIILPFSISYFIYFFKQKYKLKLISIIYNFLIIVSLILTASRNSLLGLFLGIYLSFEGIKNNSFIFFKKILLFIFILLFFLLIFDKTKLDVFLPVHLLDKLNNGFIDFSSFTRVKLINESLNLIFEKPLLGNGLPLQIPLSKLSNITHSHNLFLEISLIYGLLSSVVLFSNFLIILFKSSLKVCFKRYYIKNIGIEIFDRAWIISFTIMLVTSLFDITYYDVKISLSFWIILSGLRCILKEKEKEKEKLIIQN